MTTGDVRSAAAQRLLEASGIAHAGVDTAGQAGDVAAVRAPLGEFERIAALAPALKRLGFRYVALDLSDRSPA